MAESARCAHISNGFLWAPAQIPFLPSSFSFLLFIFPLFHLFFPLEPTHTHTKKKKTKKHSSQGHRPPLPPSKADSSQPQGVVRRHTAGLVCTRKRLREGFLFFLLFCLRKYSFVCVPFVLLMSLKYVVVFRSSAHEWREALARTHIFRFSSPPRG